MPDDTVTKHQQSVIVINSSSTPCGDVGDMVAGLAAAMGSSGEAPRYPVQPFNPRPWWDQQRGVAVGRFVR